MSSSTRRIKSKMKKCDPDSYSIHDFLSECKLSDESSSRFEDKEIMEERMFVNRASSNKQMSGVYSHICKLLVGDGWKEKKDDKGRFHMIFGGKNGSGIPFKRFSQLFKWDYGIVPHCNFFNGYVWFEKREKLVQMLRVFCKENEIPIETIFPQTFLFFPSSGVDCEIEQFRQVYESDAKRGIESVWVLKPSESTNAERFKITDSFGAVEKFMYQLEQSSPPWLIQRYVDNPLLLPSKRKWDLRIFVLLCRNYEVFWMPNGLCRTCCDVFDLADLDNKYAHFSSNGLQSSHKMFGQAERNNIMEFETMAKLMASEDIAMGEVMKTVESHITLTLMAAKSKVMNLDHADYSAFQVLAFDFLVTSNSNVYLHQVKTNPDIPPYLEKDFARDIYQLAIRPLYEQQHAAGPCQLFQELSLRRRSTNNQK